MFTVTTADKLEARHILDVVEKRSYGVQLKGFCPPDTLQVARDHLYPVSYTHLTLPTIYSV